MSKPREGDLITYRSPQHGVVRGVVSRVEGNLCWTKYEIYPDVQPFIWRFKDGLNTLHDWPGKWGNDGFNRGNNE